mmetsp:Transcript_9205/g.13812  ORF Transcript_9205/g.13812 Transcript_9205/m.13812 type:complete len:478 (-) Transcript_9205:226-1659(-)
MQWATVSLGAFLCLLLFFLKGRIGSNVEENTFELPKEYEGLWSGIPETTILGPFKDSFHFGIHRMSNGDYRFSDNVMVIDPGTPSSWQRYYVQGSGELAGTLWYCGWLDKYMSAPLMTDASRDHFIAKSDGVTWNSDNSSSITFCFDSTTGPFPYVPPESCTGCDCGNWTLSLSADATTLRILFVGGASAGHSHSKHLEVAMKRIGDSPEVAEWKDGEGFKCKFQPGERDASPVNERAQLAKISHAHLQPSKFPKEGVTCPFARQKTGNKHHSKTEEVNVKKSHSKRLGESFDHCFILNFKTDFRVEWSMIGDEKVRIRVSAQATSSSSYVSLGFRPLGRSVDPKVMTTYLTGYFQKFGMRGADIVAGDKNGVHLLYAREYTGPPILSDALKISEATSTYSAGRVSLTFTRPLIGGMLQVKHGVNASITTEAADIIWAMGETAASSDIGIGYHGPTRGLRYLDWLNPESSSSEKTRC